MHLYGSGHSVLPCQEAFPRYGSYVGFNPLTDPRVMWHNVLGAGGVRELLWLERTEDYADKFLSHQPLNEGDCLVVFSHSGRNAAGIEAAAVRQGARAVRGRRVERRQPRPAGRRTRPASCSPTSPTCWSTPGAPVEDAIVPVEGWSRPVAGSSTVLAMVLTHELIARTAVALAGRGVELPTFASPTVPGVTLDDTDRVYAVYRERMLDAQRRQLPAFRAAMGADA